MGIGRFHIGYWCRLLRRPTRWTLVRLCRLKGPKSSTEIHALRVQAFWLDLGVM